MTEWTPADEQKARECEASFQNGGPRVYVYASDGYRTAGVNLSPSAAVRCAYPGETVYARRKVGGRYVWQCAKADPQ